MIMNDKMENTPKKSTKYGRLDEPKFELDACE
jgi:hypothetical protein